jgi:hypothetical protein
MTTRYCSLLAACASLLGAPATQAVTNVFLKTSPTATNATFTGTLQIWPVQAWADGSIFVWDNFTDLTNNPPQALYRLRFP